MDIARLSPAALQLLLELKKLSGSSETALLEQAILHYYYKVLGKEALRQKLQNLTAPQPTLHALESQLSLDQQDVLSWLGEAFSNDPTPIELPKSELPKSELPKIELSKIELPTAVIKIPMKTPMKTPTIAPGPIPISKKPPRASLEAKPDLQIRRSDLGMSRMELAQQSGLEEELLQTLEEGNLILLNLQEQWSLASALDWSLETLREAINIKSF